MEPLYEKLMHYALGLLSKRAYTVQGLHDKLITHSKKFKEYLEEEREKVALEILERLKNLNYLNDLNFTERFIAERTRLKPRGRYGLTQELLKKGVAKTTLEEFWASEEGESFDELPLALELADKQIPRLKKELTNHQKRQKIYQFLASRGFSVKTTRAVIDKRLTQY